VIELDTKTVYIGSTTPVNGKYTTLALYNSTGTDFEYQADTAFASANSALDQIASLSQKTAVEDAVLNAKIQQTLDAIPRLAQSLELLALAPIRNNIELEHDVVGILPYANQTQRVRSNQVLTWLSM
jgi:hypothetical protein